MWDSQVWVNTIQFDLYSNKSQQQSPQGALLCKVQ